MIRRLVPLLAPDGGLARATGLPVEVVWQTGCANTDGLGIRAAPFLRAPELAAAVAAADIVVSHAGVGSALSALAAGRRPLLAHRSRRLQEAGDDHQAQLAAELARRGLAVHRDASAVTVEDLLSTLDGTVTQCTPPPFELAS
jgi:UDP-N-acetylglucosamine transferase subunit ALG13